MSWSLSELKHKETEQHVYDLEYDTVGSHYLFDINQDFINFYDYGCDYEISENYDVVYSVDQMFTMEKWNELFRELIKKAKIIAREL